MIHYATAANSAPKAGSLLVNKATRLGALCRKAQHQVHTGLPKCG
jgi:hypothetical protein